MKLFRLVIPILAGLMMTFATVVAFAGSRAAPANPPPITASETSLLPSSGALDIHADASGQLWITEIFSRTVRQLDPATGAYTLYTGISDTVDAQVGPDGKLWWVGGFSNTLASMDLGTHRVTSWPITTAGSTALAFDSNYRVWYTNFVLAGLYRFDPSNNQYCDVDLPDGGAGPTIVEHNGALWVSDYFNGRIGRITPTTDAYTYWALSSLGSTPRVRSFAFDPNGNVWWADPGLGKIGRLDPNTNRAALFGPPGLSSPWQVAYHAGKIWFTDPVTASLGFIDPQTAVGSVPQPVTPTVTSLTPADCATVAPRPAFSAAISTGVANFNPLVFTTTANSEGTLYQVPAGGLPYALTFVGFDLYATDTGRYKLMHIDTAAARLFLPLVRR